MNMFVLDNFWLFWSFFVLVFFFVVLFFYLKKTLPKNYPIQYNAPDIDPISAGYIADQQLFLRHLAAGVLLVSGENSVSKDFFNVSELSQIEVFTKNKLVQNGLYKKGLSVLSAKILFILLIVLFAFGFWQYIKYVPLDISMGETGVYSFLFLFSIPIFISIGFMIVQLATFRLTKKGRALYRKVQGFKVFLKTLGADKLTSMHDQASDHGGDIPVSWYPYFVSFGLHQPWYQDISGVSFFEGELLGNEFSLPALPPSVIDLHDLVRVVVKRYYD